MLCTLYLRQTMETNDARNSSACGRSAGRRDGLRSWRQACGYHAQQRPLARGAAARALRQPLAVGTLGVRDAFDCSREVDDEYRDAADEQRDENREQRHV